GPNAATIVGGGDHAVSCAPTTSNASASGDGTQSSSITFTPEELDRATAMKERHAGELMKDPAITRVGVGVSEDNPRESAVTIFVSGIPEQSIPRQIEGVRTKVIYNTTQAPAMTLEGIQSATTVKDARVRDLMG